MSKQYPGGLITKNPVVPSGPYSNDTASGIWTLDQQAYWQKLGQWPTAGNNPVDPQFNYVTMLLHGDGTNGAQNNTFLDSSTNNFTITRNGNTTQGSFSPYGDNWSNFFNGSTDYLTVPDNAAFNLGSSNFTAECWAYFNSSSDQYVFGQIQNTTANRSFVIAVVASKLYFEVRSGTTAYSITAASNVVLNQWLHIAAVRNGSTITLYQNGVSIGTVSVSGVTVNDSTNLMGVGCGGGYVAEPMNGYISNARLVVGTAVYTAAFTPPTVPLTAITNTVLLTCQSNRFVDNSSSPKTITVNGTPSVQRFNPFGTSTAYSTSVIGGSGYFDGTGDYLNTASNAAFTLGSSGNFTVECWVYLNGSQSASFAAVMTNMGNFSNAYANRWAFTINALNLRWYNSNGEAAVETALVPYQWIHLAAVRTGSVISVYVNGVEVGAQSSNQAYTTEGSLKIGFLTSAAAFKGYISDARVVKGTAVYPGEFTPPTAPLTAITNTTFLANTTNAAIFDNAMINDLETVGNAQISTSVVKYGTGSLYINGSGNALISAPSPNNILGGGDFTIEFWLYPSNTSSAYRALVSSENYAGTTGGWSLYQNGTSLEFWFSPGTSVTINATSAITASTWQHVALCRASGTLRLFVNGSSVGSVSNSTSLTGQQIWIGDNNNGSFFYEGYLDDLRITKGYARYTATFTPPTAAFFNYGPT